MPLPYREAGGLLVLERLNGKVDIKNQDDRGPFSEVAVLRIAWYFYESLIRRD